MPAGGLRRDLASLLRPAAAGRSIRHHGGDPFRSARCGAQRNMERLTLGGRGTVAGCTEGGTTGEQPVTVPWPGWLVARRRSPRLPIYQKAKPSVPLKAGRGWGILYPGVSRTQRAPAPPQPRARARPGAKRKGLRLRLARAKRERRRSGDRGSSRRAATAHPRERLDRRGMCRPVRGTSRGAQMT